MIYTSIVAYLSTIIILYLVNQQALAHTLIIAWPLILLCRLGMKLVVLMGVLVATLAHSTGTLQGQVDLANHGLRALSEGLRAIIGFLQALIPYIIKDASVRFEIPDWDELLKKWQDESED